MHKNKKEFFTHSTKIYADLSNQPETLGSQQHTIAKLYFLQSKNHKHVQDVKISKIKPTTSQRIKKLLKNIKVVPPQENDLQPTEVNLLLTRLEDSPL